VLIEKNNLEWTNSIYDKGYIYIEGLVVWGKSKTFLYFKKNENEFTYKIHILTEDISKIDMLLIGLNKYYTIDKKFLRDYQYFLKNYKENELNSHDDYKNNIKNIEQILLELKNETGFYEKYHYIDIEQFKCCNKSGSRDHCTTESFKLSGTV
jgi:hypothetical protein